MTDAFEQYAGGFVGAAFAAAKFRFGRGIAPAVGNAIFAATGKRLRSLPLAPNGI